MTTSTTDSKTLNTFLLSMGVMLVLVVGIYYQSFGWLVNLWYTNSDYLYGFLVPVFSGWLLWDRREMLKGDELRGNLWGVLVVLCGLAVSMWADYDFNQVLKAWTIVPIVGGLVILLGGWHALRWSWPAVLFLIFMTPLPQQVFERLSENLQTFGAVTSVYVLQTLGIPAMADGNVIVLPRSPMPLDVAEACSGIKMLMLFFAACTGAAFYLRNRDPLTRVIIGLSAIPIAIISNVTRITVTAILYETVNPDLGSKVFHDLAGWFMMPLAIGLLWAESALLDRLFVTEERESPLPLGTMPLGNFPQKTKPVPPKGEAPE